MRMTSPFNESRVGKAKLVLLGAVALCMAVLVVWLTNPGDLPSRRTPLEQAEADSNSPSRSETETPLTRNLDRRQTVTTEDEVGPAPEPGSEASWYRTISDEDVDISTLTANGIFESYWGEEWPRVEEQLRGDLTPESWHSCLRLWNAHKATTIGDLDEFVEALPDLLWGELVTNNRRGGGAALHAQRATRLDQPYSHVAEAFTVVEEAVEQSLIRRQTRHGESWSIAEKLQIAEQIAEREGPAILGAIDELDELGTELLGALNGAIKADLQTISKDSPPALGHLKIGPITLTESVIYTNPGGLKVFLTARAHGLPSMDPTWCPWTAGYVIHLDSLTEYTGRVAACEAARDRITTWLDAVVSSATGE